jgi:hypothetical protein
MRALCFLERNGLATQKLRTGIGCLMLNLYPMKTKEAKMLKHTAMFLGSMILASIVIACTAPAPAPAQAGNGSARSDNANDQCPRADKLPCN